MQSTPALMPIFRSRGQARLLARLLLDPGHRWWSLTDLAAVVGLAPSSVLRETERLVGAGILESERVGRVRRVRANLDSLVHPELRGLLMKAFGPVPTLTAELARVEHVVGAYIFGSWARAHLSADPLEEPPRDIDVAVIGSPDPAAVYSACARAEAEIGLEVTPVIIDVAAWTAAADEAAPFVRAVRGGDLVRLELRP